MKPYGPIAFSVNTPFQVGIDSTAANVQIHNNSGLSLRVYFGAAAPANYQDAARWSATISPGSHPVLPVTWGSYPDGTLSFFPFSEQGAPAQSFGFIGASSILTLEIYYPGEDTPQSVYSPIFQQGAAQQRSIAVPMPSSLSNAFDFTILTQASAFPYLLTFTGVNASQNVYMRQGPTGGGVSIAFYLHDLSIRFESNGAGYTAFGYILECVHLSNTLAVKSGPITMYKSVLGTIAGVGGADRDALSFASPRPTGLVIPNGTSIVVGDLFGVRLARFASLGNYNIYSNVGWSVDLTNTAALDTYGTGVNTHAADALNPRTW